ncbi:S-adenosyl-L-methionine-dependent methyltransferase [Fennellomyces sp. T-0311]|nr:S-adenosyl-L-methionine-dependent methyltransferase [Fennellomyces sp. T-0311]
MLDTEHHSPHGDSIKSRQPETSDSQNNKSFYLLSHDETEKERLRKQSAAVTAICGGNFDAPVHDYLAKGTNVLDSGCGPGTWILDMYKEYPQSTFYGIDLSPVFPTGNNAADLANCKFSCHNVLEPLPFPDNHFGFIRQQFLVGGIPEHSWPTLLKEFMRIVEPGGWIELTEVIPTDVFNLGPKYEAVNNAMIQYARERGVRMSATRELEKYLIDAGAVHIQNRPRLFPIGHIGPSNDSWIRENVISVLRHQFQPIFVKMHPELQDRESYEKHMSEIMEECGELKTSMLLYRMYAQKPMQ